ncbi:hypothetical protein PR003_g4469 [Phytophthora rubi]|uniref:Uncharacterized protein n=1 Tax=Phytophthora rubi TaxID=129364 RepID=A0A6A4FYE1_9STRA|nr:hypothetical protein PR001_g5836 [Phytophthora rubi]KAE9352267.1 hypothetical protein PR003_g4469 [Phytophthora rubi]
MTGTRDLGVLTRERLNDVQLCVVILCKRRWRNIEVAADDVIGRRKQEPDEVQMSDYTCPTNVFRYVTWHLLVVVILVAAVIWGHVADELAAVKTLTFTSHVVVVFGCYDDEVHADAGQLAVASAWMRRGRSICWDEVVLMLMWVRMGPQWRCSC